MNATSIHSASTVPLMHEEPPSGATAMLATDFVSILDVTSILFAVQSEQQHTQEAQHEADIRAHASEIKLALEQVRKAAEEARAQAEEGSFWSDFVSVAKTVAAVAAVAGGVAGGVVSGGLTVAGGLALAGALVSACATPIAQAVGGDDKVAFWIGIGGAALSLGGSAGAILLKGTKPICDVAFNSVARYADWAARGVEAGATGVEGYGQIRAGIAQADSTRAEADGLEARAHQRVTQRELETLIEGLKELTESFARAKDALLESQQQSIQSHHLLVATLGR
jgi:hypothetical protein